MIYDRLINFGALPMPEGCYVVQLDTGHYLGTNDLHGEVPRDKAIETAITVNRFHARKWIIQLTSEKK